VDSGATVINISLGYRTEYSDKSPDLPYAVFDGRTRPSSLAALGAARRNVLVTVSMGNEGAEISGTPSLSAPGDADSILALGMANASGARCGFSSTGPASDGRIKPDLSTWSVEEGCRVPMADTRKADGYRTATGTSFAAPVAAGAVALLRQIHPTLSAEEIRQAILRTASQYSSPDGELGYGLLRAADALDFLRGKPRDPAIFYAKKPVRFSAFFDRALSGIALRPENGLDPTRTRLFSADGRHRSGTWQGDTLTSQGSAGILFGEIPLERNP
jgi:subtilisin family serine protease